jgi:tRNA(His) guanylyltransferase
MNNRDSIGDRIKGYEGVWNQQLPNRMPVIIRVDGKAFHTYTRGCKKPYDHNLIEVMNDTAIKLCEKISTVQMAYVQSDEISLLLHPYKKLQSQAWFDNQVQKMVSVSAALASVTFTHNSWKIWIPETNWAGHYENIKPAYFDSRCFILPEAEVVNYFIWRQQDATRNSVQMLARALYSHKECTDKNNSQLQEMCFQKGKNWNDEPASFKRGRCIVKQQYEHNNVTRNRWVVDEEIPIFTQDRDYVEKHLVLAPEEEG